MFETLHVPILGIIENMSTFTCPHCGKDTDVFRSGGGERISEQLGVPFLGAIPLDANIVTGGDEGRPMLLDKPDSVAAQAYLAIATALADQLQGLPTMVLRPFAWTWEWGEGEQAWVESAVQPWVPGRPRSASASEMRGRCPCSGRMGTVTTSMSGTFGWIATVPPASRRPAGVRFWIRRACHRT